MSFDPTLLEQKLDEITKETFSATRKAAQAGAQVLYDEVRLNVNKIKKVTGNLDRSIYQAFSEDKSWATGYEVNGLPAYEKAIYHVSWNAKEAPHGHLVEYGHVVKFKPYLGSDGNWYTSKSPTGNEGKQYAQPFLRPAWDSKRVVAQQAMQDRWIAEMKKAL
jgi:HK97 gp10 family phage protein